MGYSIYEDTVEVPTLARLGAEEKTRAAQELFLQHAGSSGLVGQDVAFDHLCAALAEALPELPGLAAPEARGSAFEFLDANRDGQITLEELVAGLGELLDPSTEPARELAERLAGRAQAAEGFAHVQRVAVIGAGVAGLQVANLLRPLGKQVVIFEKSEDVGGVWRQNYADFSLQVPRELYEFPGFPWPSDLKAALFPEGPKVQEYIQRYAREFGIYECIKFRTAVLDASPRKGGQRGWTLTHQAQGAERVTEDFDFVVVATGMYSWPPHVPVARGAEKFKGEILHSCTFTDRRAAAGKKVVVVGGGKSAIDNAVAAAREAESTVLLCRDAHWPVPRYLANLVPFKWGTYSRFGHAMLPAHHEVPSCAWWTHSTCAPLKWVWWRVVETMFRAQFCIPADKVPKEPIEHDLFTGGQILTYDFRKMTRAGQIRHLLGAVSHFTETGVVLTDGTALEADVVIYGTGFAKSYGVFGEAARLLLDAEKDGLWLYRNILPPRLRDLAFIGSEVSTFNNVLTHGLQALWLQRLLAGSLRLPAAGAMQRQLEKERAWKRSWMPPSSARASIWQLHMMVYHDNLLRDLGEDPKRKGHWNPLREVFAPYTARDYAGLFHLAAPGGK